MRASLFVSHLLVVLQVVSALHVRSVVAVLAVLSYCAPAVQVVSAAHWRSLEAPGAAVWYCDEAEHSLMLLQVRSVVPEAGDDSNWPSTHAVCAEHVRSVVLLGAAVSYSVPEHTVLAWQMRSCEPAPACVWCWVAVHTV